MNKLILKLAAVVIAIFVMIGLGACSSSTDTAPHSTTGTYVYTGDGSAMVGEVVDDTITINLKGRDDISLYWAGSFVKQAANGAVVTSKGNVEQMKASMTGSMDSSKEFTIDGDKIIFKMSAMGMTKTVELEKNSSYTN